MLYVLFFICMLTNSIEIEKKNKKGNGKTFMPVEAISKKIY